MNKKQLISHFSEKFGETKINGVKFANTELFDEILEYLIKLNAKRFEEGLDVARKIIKDANNHG